MVKIFFNSKLTDLSHFLSPNDDVTGICTLKYDFISHIVSIDFSNFDTSEVITTAKKF